MRIMLAVLVFFDQDLTDSMRLKATIILPLIAFLLLSFPLKGNANSQALTARQIQALFPGIYTGVADGKHNFIVSGGTNGQLIGRAKGIEKKIPWKISGNKLCIAITEGDITKSFCSRIMKEGTWYKAVKNDGTSHVKFKPYKDKNK